MLPAKYKMVVVMVVISNKAARAVNHNKLLCNYLWLLYEMEVDRLIWLTSLNCIQSQRVVLLANGFNILFTCEIPIKFLFLG